MLFRPKEYLKPTSIDEAVSLLAKHGEKAIPLAGGTDILVDKPSDIGRCKRFSRLSLSWMLNR